MAVLVVLVAAVVVVVLVVRASAAPGGLNRGGRVRAPRPPCPPRARESRPVVGPDDDPEFLRELQRRARRDDFPA